MIQAPAAVAAEPAFVAKIGGKGVAVVRGAEKTPVQVQTLLSGGDRVVTGEKSFVEVKYLSDGCTVRVGGGNSLVVADASPCAGSEAAAPQATPEKLAEAAGSGEAKIVPAAAEAGAAQVIGQTGSITRVNRGQGLVELATGTELKAGDLVFAGPGSTVTLHFAAAGCDYIVADETYFQVPAAPPCVASTTAGVAQDGTTRDVAALEVAGQDDDDNDRKVAALLAGALVVGGGTLAILALSQEDDNNNPLTPQ